MTCSECRRELGALEELSKEALPRAVGDHIATCSDCRRVLAALELLETGASLRAVPPEGLVESIVARTSRRRRLFRSRVVGLRTGILAAAAVLLVVFGSFVVRPAFLPDQGQPNLVRVHLVLQDPTARSVSVVGDWNNWRAGAQPMRKKNGTWQITVRLKRGLDYQYQFLVNNDKWIPDPHAPLEVENGFGGKNSVLAT